MSSPSGGALFRTGPVIMRNFFLGLFGASFYFLATPKLIGIPIRLGLSDMFLFGFLAFWVIRWRRMSFIRFRHRWSAVPWLFAVALVLVIAFLRGPGVDDAVHSWAIVKTVGILVLIGYFAGGMLVSSQLGDTMSRFFCWTFVLSAWASGAYALFRYILAFWSLLPESYYPRMAAFVQNPNAFGILLAAALMLQLVFARQDHLFGWRIHVFAAALLLLDIFLSASRSAYLAVIFGLGGLSIRKRVSFPLVACSVVIASLLFLLLFHTRWRVPNGYQKVQNRVCEPFVLNDRVAPESTVRQPRWPVAATREQLDVGLIARIQLTKDAVAMWRDHPLLGAGLGSFLREQTRLHPDNPAGTYANHNSALWLLSEMGLLGFGVMAGFFVSSVMVLLRENGTSPIPCGVFGILLALAGASLGTEVLYQRYLWFFLGLGLTEPVTRGGPLRERDRS